MSMVAAGPLVHKSHASQAGDEDMQQKLIAGSTVNVQQLLLHEVLLLNFSLYEMDRPARTPA